MDDQRLTEQLWQRNESALAEVESRYSRLYMGMLRRVLHDEQDVQECANDVLTALWNSIPPNRPTYLSAYICKIARRIGIDRLRYNTRSKRSPEYTILLSELEDCLPDANLSLEEAMEQKELRDVLSEFIRNLEPQTQVFFIRRYLYLETVQELAQRFRRRENYIAVCLYRARKKLRTALEKEGISL